VKRLGQGTIVNKIAGPSDSTHSQPFETFYGGPAIRISAPNN